MQTAEKAWCWGGDWLGFWPAGWPAWRRRRLTGWWLPREASSPQSFLFLHFIPRFLHIHTDTLLSKIYSTLYLLKATSKIHWEISIKKKKSMMILEHHHSPLWSWRHVFMCLLFAKQVSGTTRGQLRISYAALRPTLTPVKPDWGPEMLDLSLMTV